MSQTNLQSSFLAAVVILFLSVSGFAADAGVAVGDSEPVWRIPKVSQELKLSPERSLIGAGTFEWMGASAASGFVELDDSGKSGGLVPGADASIYIAYSEDALFVGFLFPMPEGVVPLASTTENQSDGIERDDHFLLRLSFESRERAATSPHFEIMVNSGGFFRAVEREFLPGQTRLVGTESIRVTTNLAQNYMRKDWWSLKIRIPLADLGVKSLDLKQALLQAELQLGDLRLALPGAAWSEAYSATFDPKAPLVFKLNGSFAGLAHGRDKSAARWVLHSKAQGRVKILEATPEDGTKTAMDEELVAGQKLDTTLRAKFPGGEGGIFSSLVWVPESGEATPIYAAPWPAPRSDSSAADKWQAWAAARTVEAQAEIRTDYVFDPYTGNLEVFVNRAKAPGSYNPEEAQKLARIESANSISCQVLDAGGKILASERAALEGVEGRARLDLGENLADGDYRVVGQVIAGEEVVAENSLPLVRKRAVWEKSDLGRDRVVFPPFREITRKNDSFHLLGREYRIGDNALPTAITSQGKSMLGGPIRLEAGAGGKTLPVEFSGAELQLIPGKKFPESHDQFQFQATAPVPELEPTDGYQGRATARGKIGELRAQVDGTLEFEGLYRVTLTLDSDTAAELDRLDLVIPLNNDFNTMRFTRHYGLEGSGSVPAGEGVLFSSAQMPKLNGVYNTFIPSVYVGDYLTGMWWMASWDKGWISNDEDALVQLERIDGQLQLRIRFVTIPAKISGRHTLEFALLASPTAPAPENYRRMEWAPTVAHDTSGYRYYGEGVNGFHLKTEEDYAALRDYLYTRPFDELEKPGTNAAGDTYRYSRKVSKKAREGAPVIFYGSIYGASASMDEFPAYGSGWIMTARTDTISTDENLRGRVNYGGNRQWLTDDQARVVFVKPTQSFYDAHLYHMVQIATKAGINGHFHDNFQKFPTAFGVVRSDAAGTGYRRADGKVQARSVVLDKHDWNKRFYTALWLAGRPPQMLGSNEQNNAFKRNWFVEGEVYIRTPDGNYVKQGLTPDVFRGFTSRTFPLANLTAHFPNEVAARMGLAYMFLHDIGVHGTNSEIFRKVDAFVGFLDGGAKILPYWQDRDWITTGTDDVTVGALVAHDRGKAVLVAINTADREVEFAFSPQDSLLGRAAAAVRDLESEKPITGTAGKYAMKLQPYETVFLAVE